MVLLHILFGLTLVTFIRCTLVYNTDCQSKQYTRIYNLDDTIFDNGFLEEKLVGMRADCFPLCNQKKTCNMVLYNSVSSACRFYNYHYNTSEAGTAQTGWQYYGVSCATPSNPSECNSIPTVPLECSSCLEGNVWTTDGFCVLYKASTANLVEDEAFLPLPFGLETGMNVIIRGSVSDLSDSWVEVFLDSAPNYNYYIAIEFNTEAAELNTFTEDRTIIFNDPFPIINPSNFTITFQIQSASVKIYADGTFIRMYTRPPTVLNEIYVYGMNEVHQEFVRTPSYCN